MVQIKKTLSLATVFLLALLSAKAQYPDIPADVQKAADSLLKAANKHSDSAWAVAYPIIQNDAKHGKPYIPWASRWMNYPNLKYRHSRVQKAEVNSVLADVAVK
jgi:hypothetical protein